MRILVTGSKGQLGSELKKLSELHDHTCLFTDIEELDICSGREVRAFFDQHPVDVVINCAAYTAVDKAESEIEKALMINATAPKILAETCRLYEAVMIHISTDFVFDGQSCRPYTEQDATAPVNVYGQTKFEGEIRVLRENPRSLVIRTSWLYSSIGHNFVKTMIRLGLEKKKLNVIFDQVGTPTYANDLAAALYHIIERMTAVREYPAIWGVYHYSNEGVASWYDFADEIFRIKKIRAGLNPARSSEFPTPAKRPSFSVMDKGKIKETFDLSIPHWKDSLVRCLELMDQ